MHWFPTGVVRVGCYRAGASVRDDHAMNAGKNRREDREPRRRRRIPPAGAVRRCADAPPRPRARTAASRASP